MDVTSTLQRLCLQPTTQPHFHVMFLECPVTSLLPKRPGIGLGMEPPKAALYREIPSADKYFLREQGLHFFVRFPVQKSNPADPESETQSLMSTAIDRLSQCGGRSTLEAVTVSDDDYCEGGYIFRLTTIWHDSHAKEVCDFQMRESDWRDTLALSGCKPWTHLLQDLFSRASDRAYLHVERQLQGSEYFAIDALKWDVYESLDVNRLLAINMRVVSQRGTMFCLEPIRDFHGDGERLLAVRLPCEHESTVSLAYLQNLSLAACIDMACPICGQTILPDKDIVHAHHSVERRRRQRKALDETLWKHIEVRNIDRSTRLFTSGSIMCKALAHALQSMQVPESVSPRVLSPAWSVEAATTFEKVNNAHGGSSETMFSTLADIHTHLMRTAHEVVYECCGLQSADISDCILPGWSTFLRRWLDRTVSLMAMPDYGGEDVWQALGEVPDDDICFDDEEEVLGGDVDIGAELGRVSLL